LNRFRMQQVGESVRFEDSDKSVYAGPVTAQGAGTNSFRAVGTNLTLRQPVVVTGRFYKTQAPAPAQQPGAQYQGGARQALGANQQYSGSYPEEVRVQGEALVGSSNRIQVDAQSSTER
jgi:hypothetical protein